MKQEKAINGMIIGILFMLAVSPALVSGDDIDGKIAEYLAAHPLDATTRTHLNSILERAKSEDLKLRMELTRRIDFYFYISNKVDNLMEIYSASLLPMVYQKDLYQGNTLQGTPAILRAPIVINILNLFIQVLQPFYAISILLTGVYLLFLSGSPEGRAKAKATLIKLIIGLGIITLTLPILEMFLEISHYVTSVIISIPSITSISKPLSMEMFMSVKEFFIKYFLRITFFDVFLGLPFLAILMLLPIGVLMTLSVRYYMIILLTLFFPFTVFLYSFMATKRIGFSLIQQTFMWIFIPVINGLILLVTWTAYTSTPYISGLNPTSIDDVHTFMAVSGSILLIATPIIGFWIIRWINYIGFISYMLMTPTSSVEAYLEVNRDEEYDTDEFEEEEDDQFL